MRENQIKKRYRKGKKRRKNWMFKHALYLNPVTINEYIQFPDRTVLQNYQK